MRSSLLTKSPFQATVIASVIAFMLLNAFVPLNFPTQAEATEYPFKMTITLEKTSYKIRELINPIFYLQNVGEESVWLTLREFDFILFDDNFNEIYRWSKDHGWIQNVPKTKEMKPGEVVNVTYLTWYQDVDFEYFNLGTPDFVIHYYWAEPGTYYITGLFNNYFYNVTLETPPIRIAIAQ